MGGLTSSICALFVVLLLIAYLVLFAAFTCWSLRLWIRNRLKKKPQRPLSPTGGQGHVD